MDILCPNCAEPWDMDTLHDVADIHGSFDAAYKVFRTKGCGEAFGDYYGNHCVPAGRPELAELAYLLGDDVDGYASMCEDFGL